MLSQQSVRRRTVLAALATAAATGSGAAAAERVAGSGTVRAQTRQLASFSGVALALPAQLEVRTGGPESITIEASENLLPLIETAVENGSLQIRPVRRGLTLSAGVLRMIVTAPRVDKLSIAGAGAISAAALRAPQLKLQAGGGGSIVLTRIECDSLAASIAGAGLIGLDGNAPELSASIAGAGQLRAARLQTRTANVSILGAGEATVWAAGELNASIAGSGRLRYYGSPALHAATVGSGSAERLGPAPS